jgi:hypothetical protein
MTTVSETQPKTRRRLRFSLRAIFVLITLVACVAAWAGMQIARRHREEAAIKHLVKGATTSTYWASLFDQPASADLNPLMPLWPRRKTGLINRLRNLDMFQTVVMFSIHPGGNTFAFDADEQGRLVIHRDYKAGLRDDDMAVVAKLVNLRTLWLEANGITDNGLVQLAGLKNLELLWLQNTPVTDAGMATLENFPKLRDLDLSATDVTDMAIDAWSRCRVLRKLKVENTRVTSEGVARLQKLLPDCEITK